MGWACDWEGTYAYRERIAVSDGKVRCCESGILIPKGYPYADCRPAWWNEGEDLPKNSEGQECEDPDSELTTTELLPLLNTYPQCIEVWRRLRNDSSKRGSCPSWGNAVSEYWDAAADDWDVKDRLAAVSLETLIKRTKQRYEAAKRPRLHPHEQTSLESGQFVRALPYSYKTRQREAA